MDTEKEKYKLVIDFLMNQINAMTGDGEDFDFEMAAEVLKTVGLDVDDYIIY